MPNTINGDSGNNTLAGTSGDDEIYGFAGDDTLGGDIGTDILIGGEDDDLYFVDDATDTVIESLNEGTDTISASVSWSLAANIENLILTGLSNLNGTGNADNNTITGNAGTNTLDGGAGDDMLIGSDTDTLTGGINDDIYVVDHANVTLVENNNEGRDTVWSSVTWTLGANFENLLLTGAGNINGTGNTLDNFIWGNSGNNTLDGGGGSNDFVFYTLASGGVTVNLATGAATGYGTDTLSNIEHVQGSDYNDTLTGDSFDNTLIGGTGADTMAGGAGNDYFVVDNAGDIVSENASEGTDEVVSAISYTLTANVENLYLRPDGTNIDGTGNSLDNLISGNSGINTMAGGAGNDTYEVQNSTDIVTEASSAGTDTVRSTIDWTLGSNLENLTLLGTAVNGTGNSLNNIITGNAEDNTINSETGTDTMYGGDGNDVFDSSGGTPGVDTMYGGDGNDVYYVDASSLDIVVEDVNDGVDIVFFTQSNVSYTLTANVENLTLTVGSSGGIGNSLDNIITGSTSSNTLDGGDGSDTLYGMAGTDILLGGSANDTLDGGSGNDSLYGGTGDDVYYADSILGEFIVELSGEGTDIVMAEQNHTLAAYVENLTLIGSDDVDATGNSLDNIITGNSNINTLNGAGGIDTLAGGDGNDLYVVDTATDTIIENTGEGIDTVQSSATITLSMANVENLTLTGSSTINGTGNSLDNVIMGNSLANVLNGLAGNDSIDGWIGNDTMDGGDGNDSLSGSSGVDTILGGSGNDTLDGGSSADSMAGGTDNDYYIVNTASDIVSENASEGTDTVQSDATYTLTSNVENLILATTSNINGVGNTLNNTITGNSGLNTLDGGTGVDTMIGGAGNDVYIVDDAGDVTTENSSEGTDSVQSSVTHTLAGNVENLTLTGSSNLNGGGNSLDNTITGNSGTNTLNGGAGNDLYIIASGDVVVENSSEGTDTIQVGSTWTLDANIENLTLTGASVINGTGNSLDNIINGTSGANTLTGGDGNDTIDGNNGNDTLIGGDGNDFLDGDGNVDVLIGGTGDDTYVVDNGSDSITENASEGTDTVQANLAWTLGSNLENLTITSGSTVSGTGNSLANTLIGGSGTNSLVGGSGNDVLKGAGGSDILKGGDDNDTLYGEAGTDDMYGESGADTFVFELASAFSNIDIVRDFSTGAGDAIDISDLLADYDPMTEALTDFVRIQDSGLNSTLEIDRDGTGGTYSFNQIATLNSITGITDEDALVTNGNLIVT